MGDEPPEVVFLDADGRPRLPEQEPPPSRGWRWLLAAVCAGLLLLAALAIRSTEAPPSAVPTPTPSQTHSPSIRLIPAPLPDGEGAGLVDLAGCTNCARVLDVPMSLATAVSRRFPTAEIGRVETVISSTTGRLFSRSVHAGLGEGLLLIDVAVDPTGLTKESVSTQGDGSVRIVVQRAGYRVTLRTLGVPVAAEQLHRLAVDPALVR